MSARCAILLPMTRRRRRCVGLASFALIASAAACANILGIDDGIPRTTDASADVTIDVETDAMNDVVDAGPDIPFSPLSCDKTTCNFALGQTCCRTGAATFACIDAGDSCSGLLIPCDRADQCPPDDAGAQECCTTDILTDGGIYVATGVGCMPTAKCSPIPTHYLMCGDLDAADCPDGTSCTPSVSTLPPFLICK